MNVRPAFKQPQMKIAQKRDPQFFTIPASVGGVSSARSIGVDNQGFAQVLENGYVTQTGVSPRAGKLKHATTSTKSVRALLTYESGSIKKIFACANNSIYDVTSPASNITPPAASVSSLGGDLWRGVNFANPSGTFLIAVNGVDVHRTYDGSAWAANTPAITGKSSALFSNVASYGSRLWFIEKNSLSVWFLPIDQIGGAATELSFRAIFKKGGTLRFASPWSLESGDGLSRKIVFVTSNGEAAVYQGVDPTNASTWQLVGVYDVTSPLGDNAYMNVGGDLFIATISGVIPITAAIGKDATVLSLSSITREISPEWKAFASKNRNQQWSLVKWPEKNLIYVAAAGSYSNVSGTDTLDLSPILFACTTKATDQGQLNSWSKYTGWDIQSLAYLGGEAYFGSANGKVYKAESTGSDDGDYYVFRSLSWPDSMGAASVTKTFSQIRTTFTYSQPFNAQVTIATDYNANWLPVPSAPANNNAGVLWDGGSRWDSGLRWDQAGTKATESIWNSVGTTGYKGAVMTQMLFNNSLAPDVEIVSHEISFFAGSLVT